jgi:hypothetical protein
MIGWMIVCVYAEGSGRGGLGHGRGTATLLKSYFAHLRANMMMAPGAIQDLCPFGSATGH